MAHVVDLDAFDGVVFDLDGVVTDTASVHAAAWGELFDGFLAEHAPGEPPFDRDEEYRRYVDGRARADGVSSFLRSRGIDLPWGEPDDPPGSGSVCALGNRKDGLFLDSLRRDGVTVFGTTVTFARRVRAAGRPIAVVSASRNCREVLAAARLDALFDVVVDGITAAEERLPGKPDPATFLAASALLGTDPGRTVVVEDAVAGVEAGRRGRFGLVVGVDRHGSGDLERAGADVVIADLADLVVADRAAWSVGREERPGDRTGRVHDALFALSDGTVGVRGDIETGEAARGWLTLANGAFGAARDGLVRLLPGPSLAPLLEPEPARNGSRRTLDLATGVLVHEASAPDGLTAFRFVSLADPGVVVVHADGPADARWNAEPLTAPRLGPSDSLAATYTYRSGTTDGAVWAETTSDRATVRAVARQCAGNGARSTLDRVVVVRRTDGGAAVDVAPTTGFDALFAEQRRAWAARWDAADIEIEGDPASQQAIRFALFHLLSCAPTRGEVAVGARGLTGLAYSGHVFWDADVFVLPALAATIPDAARAILDYRVRRLDVVRGRDGARFPWESADDGREATPGTVRDFRGKVVPIRTGTHEVHINTAVAWAADHYLAWTGDDDVRPAHAELIIETARWWATRITCDADGRAHLNGVMGPDEYHEIVDDNAYTNVMVRWHLRRAAALLDGGRAAEARRWRALANALVDGFDPATHRHEQFAGFSELEPLVISEITDVPVAADVLLGPDRVARAQVLKQADVLMLHHLVPDEVPPGSLAADVDFYVPRTAHGSSLSPAVCASVLARAGRPDEAMALFDVAARLDLDDLTQMTAGGIHLATLGGLWQATVRGFAGIRPVGDRLVVEPRLPSRWSRLRVRLRYRGVPLQVEIEPDRIVVEGDGPSRAVVHGVEVTAPACVVRRGRTWRRKR